MSGFTQYIPPYTASTEVRCNRPNGIDLETLQDKPGGCGYKGPLGSYLPNLTSVRNAVRCPQCGSTRNAYNSAHSAYMSGQINKTIQDTVLEVLDERDGSSL